MIIFLYYKIRRMPGATLSSTLNGRVAQESLISPDSVERFPLQCAVTITASRPSPVLNTQKML